MLRPLCLCDALFDVRLYFRIFGKALFFLLGKYEFAIHGHFKFSTRSGIEHKSFDILLELVDQLVRQTDGLFFITSSRAIFKFDFYHVRPPVMR